MKRNIILFTLILFLFSGCGKTDSITGPSPAPSSPSPASAATVPDPGSEPPPATPIVYTWLTARSHFMQSDVPIEVKWEGRPVAGFITLYVDNVHRHTLVLSIPSHLVTEARQVDYLGLVFKFRAQITKWDDSGYFEGNLLEFLD